MATPLVLLVHGRSGGVVPTELQQLAAELAQRRGGPVLVQALTAAEPPLAAAGQAVAEASASQLLLVPLMLLPGGHVRADVPAIAAQWRAQLPVRLLRWPFLGAWPSWQRALRDELADLRLQAGPGRGPVQLLHHPLEGPLGQRFIEQLSRRTGAQCRPTPYSADQLAALQLTLNAPALPLALAANRLTDALAQRVGLPLLQRPRFRQLLLEQLEALP